MNKIDNIKCMKFCGREKIGDFAVFLKKFSKHNSVG
jgi:hypothetical protein